MGSSLFTFNYRILYYIYIITVFYYTMYMLIKTKKKSNEFNKTAEYTVGLRGVDLNQRHWRMSPVLYPLNYPAKKTRKT
jgi:hypothetical protein